MVASGLEQILALNHGGTSFQQEDEEALLLAEMIQKDSNGADMEQELYELDPCDWEEEDLATAHHRNDAPKPIASSTVLPTKWNAEVNGPYHASLSSDHRTAHYVGKANHPQDVGTVKADRPLPHHQAYFYFEVSECPVCVRELESSVRLYYHAPLEHSRMHAYG